MLSYDYQIKPLREASSSNLLPAVINYRVDAGQRDGKNKVNQPEAKAIVALMRACMEQPEYEGKSFGVISLLGDEQYQLIQKEIDASISPKEIMQRNILCGNSANFQGDERDVIFLSLVDSKDIDNPGPLHLQNYGVDDSTRKRYNVAVSRARDQLWVVHSLDAANDLKPGDIRKKLLDYAANPHALEIAHEKISAASESPFEKAVATALSDRGYHLVQQWEVGAYRLDMVAVCGGKTVAIECDGERWHSGDTKIREDMERQTILERLGWRFIRIRGSEYYRAPQQTIERVIGELAQYGIEPEDAETVVSDDRNTELLLRIKNRAAAILASESVGEGDNASAVEAALNPRLLEELRQDSEQSARLPEKNAVSESCIPARQRQSSENRVRKPEKPASKKTKGKETLSTSHKQPAILREPILVPGISGPEMVSKADKQQVIPGLEDVLPEDDDNHPAQEERCSFCGQAEK